MAQTQERITLGTRARDVFLRRAPKDTPEAFVVAAAQSARRTKSLTAAAIPIEGREGSQAWKARAGDDAWQKQAWYYYDAVGELRFAFNWLANAISRATVYAAEIDPETGLIGEATEDARAQAAAEQVLGGMDDRAQLQSTLALQWQVAGETFILIQPQGTGTADRWAALSSRAVRQQGGTWSFKDPITGVWTKLRSGTDRLIRIWSPHPDEQTHADSAMRAAIPILNEVEKSSQNIVARLESRLASNGILFIPQEIDFPTAPGQQANAASFMSLLLEAMEASLRDPGQAAAQVPIVAQVPADMIASLANGHVDLSTEMDSAVTELRRDALNRVGATLDMPRELAMGELAGANHWSGWLIEESTYKIHVEPFLLKLGMALVKTWYRPALVAMGMSPQEAERFVLVWDITEVVARPDDKDDVKYLLENNLVSRDWVRGKFNVPDDAIPSDEEARLNLATVLATNAPTVLENASIAAVLGFEPTTGPDPASSGTADSGEAGSGTTNVRALPATSATPDADAGLVAAAELVVFDALSRAGGRLLTRQYRGQFASTPKWELHTVIPRGERDMDSLMADSFQFSDNVAHAFSLSPVGFRHALDEYVTGLLSRGQAHNRALLTGYLRTVRPE